jgi:hypothetical protein
MGYMGVMCLRSAARRARGPESSNMLTSHADTRGDQTGSLPQTHTFFSAFCWTLPFFSVDFLLTMLYTPCFTRTYTRSDPLSSLPFTHILPPKLTREYGRRLLPHSPVYLPQLMSPSSS